jgi:hypothetical protein
MHAAGSLLAGGGIQALNLKALERSVRRVLGLKGTKPGGAGVVAVVVRTALLFAVVFWVLAATPVHAPAFAVGLLLAVPASIWHGLGAREGDQAR